MVILPLQSLFPLSLSSCTTLAVCLHFHSGIIKTHCLYSQSVTEMIHHLVGRLFFFKLDVIVVAACLSPCWSIRVCSWSDTDVCAHFYPVFVSPHQPCSPLVCKQHVCSSATKNPQKYITVFQACTHKQYKYSIQTWTQNQFYCKNIRL